MVAGSKIAQQRNNRASHMKTELQRVSKVRTPDGARRNSCRWNGDGQTLRTRPFFLGFSQESLPYVALEQNGLGDQKRIEHLGEVAGLQDRSRHRGRRAGPDAECLLGLN